MRRNPHHHARGTSGNPQFHTALAKFEDHSWIGIFTNSFSNLQAIRLHYYKPGLATAPHYHHHMLLLPSISDLLETRKEK